MSFSFMSHFPKTAGQCKYLLALQSSKPIVVGVGPAGCGKTMLACREALSFVGGTNRGRIVITRPIVPADDRDLGYLPGDLEQKMLPFTMPMYDVFESTYPRTTIDRFLSVEPLGFMRGRTFSNTWLIADEMQNATKEQMKMLLTRVGPDTKLIITGDPDQSDLGPDNGLSDLLYRIDGFDLTHIDVVHLDKGDILRHPSVQEVIKIYEI